MAWIGFLTLLVAVLAYFALRGRNRGSTADSQRMESSRSPADQQSSTAKPTKASELAEHVAYLKARWAEAELERDAGSLKSFPKWFFDPVTERQLERIDKDGLSVKGSGLTKGAASDLIGLSAPVDAEDKEVLRFFKEPLTGMNQTLGRYRVRQLLAVPANAAAWKQRPADALQREAMRFYGVSIPKGLTFEAAAALISGTEAELLKAGSPLPDEWGEFGNLVDELSDSENCKEYGIKKPGLSVVRAAVDELRKAGNSMEDIAGDLDLVAEKIIEMRPEMARKD